MSSPFRTPARVDKEAVATRVRMKLSFYQRWRVTIWMAAGLSTALPFQLTAPDGVSGLWLVGVFASLLICALVETKFVAPRFREAMKTRRWLEQLERTPDGGALITRDDWDRRPAEFR